MGGGQVRYCNLMNCWKGIASSKPQFSDVWHQIQPGVEVHCAFLKGIQVLKRHVVLRQFQHKSCFHMLPSHSRRQVCYT